MYENYMLLYTLPWATITAGELAALILLMLFAMLSLLEAHFPKLKSQPAVRRQSFGTNIGLFLVNSALLSVLSALFLWTVADRFSGYGLLNHVSSPIGKAFLAFLGLDLTLYLWHRACHKFEALWMFHRVHHSDLEMNVSTAFRTHMLEQLITSLIKAVYIIALGVDKTIVLIVEAVMTFFVMFQHANIGFPGESQLKRLIIVPYLHRVHHSVQRHEHDRNYGLVLSVWDRLFGTLAELEPAAIGIKNNPGPDIMSQLLLGFTPLPKETPAPYLPMLQVRTMIEEAAYYKAINRGFLPGNEMADWLEAEREISRLIDTDKAQRHRRRNPELACQWESGFWC
jgi:sterol desaturase/sphingolipid hydroxylase (fatty acid hydroxylase superfamily)